MGSHVELAVSRRGHGYNCAQAIACTYADLVGMTEDQMFRLSEGFGAGMGGMEGTCGALAGVCILDGLLNSGGAGSRTAPTTLKKMNAIVQEFRKQTGATRCRDLKGKGTLPAPVPCSECVRIAAELAEQTLFSQAQ